MANDYPFDEIVKAAEGLIKKNIAVFQKFTCGGCGQRLGIDEPNHFYAYPHCEECGTVTDIRKQGCNYMTMAPAPADAPKHLTVTLNKASV